MKTLQKSLKKIEFSPLVQAIGLLFTAQLGINFYLAALPEIALHFKVDSEKITASLYLYLIAYGLIQIFIPGLRKYFTDKTLIFLAFLMFCTALIALIFSPNITFFYFARALQGLGAGILSLMVKVLLQKNYQAEKLLKVFAILEASAIFIPCLAPLFGAYLLNYLSFHWLFGFNLTFALVVLFLLKNMPVNSLENRTEKSLNIYKNLLKNNFFIYHLSALLLLYFCILVSMSWLPFLLQKNNFPLEIYGYLQLGLGLGIFSGTFLSKKNNFSNRQLLFFNFILLTSGLILFFLAEKIFISLGFVFLIFFAIHVVYGVLFPIFMSNALKNQDFPAYAAAILGAVQLTGAALGNLAMQTWIDNKLFLIAGIWCFSGIFLALIHFKINKLKLQKLQSIE